MKKLSPFFFILFIITIIPIAYATTSNAGINAIVEGLTDDATDLDPGEELDLSEDLEALPEEEKTVGGVEVTLTKKVTINSIDNNPIELTNTSLEEVTVEIPNGAGISGPTSWDGTIAPPTLVATDGIVQTGFQTPTSSIEVGDPNVILFFDTPVTLNLDGITGQIAYKLSGNNNWILILTCDGTFANPFAPVEPNECSITDGIDTKVLTWHFTEFTDLTPDTPDTPSTPDTPDTPNTSSTSSSGSGKTGVGSPRIFGPGSSSSGGGYSPPGETKQTIFPAWFDNTTQWYREGKISALEFLNAYQWVVENIMK